MQRVDLRDDGLRPERVGRAKSTPAKTPASTEPVSADATQTSAAQAAPPAKRRGEVQAVRGLAAGDREDRIGDGEVERIGLARCEPPVADRGLIGRRVAKVEPGQQRGASSRQT